MDGTGIILHPPLQLLFDFTIDLLFLEPLSGARLNKASAEFCFRIENRKATARAEKLEQTTADD